MQYCSYLLVLGNKVPLEAALNALESSALEMIGFRSKYLNNMHEYIII